MNKKAFLCLLSLLLPLLISCSSNPALNHVTHVVIREMGGPVADVAQVVQKAKSVQKDVIAFEALVRLLAKHAKVNWGDEKSASSKEYVKYTNNYRTRVFVNFEQGKVHIETLDHKDLRQAIIVTLLTPYDPDNVDLFSDKAIQLGEKPMLYGQVLDQQGKAIRWKWRAQRYADHLLNNQLFTRSSSQGKVYSVDLDLTQNHLVKRQYQYANIVRQMSKRYSVNESLIYAIMRTESSFNPYAVSHANAYGLMQIIPSTAGKDVFKLVKKKSGKPSKHYLFKPYNNIDTGTAYLHLLKTRYLREIRNPKVRHYAIISAYNGGAGNVLKTFHSNRKKAMAILNRMDPDEAYWALTKKHPRQESRNYLKKVTRAQKDFYQGDV